MGGKHIGNNNNNSSIMHEYILLDFYPVESFSKEENKIH
jgi:hypothetical protein